MDVQIIILLCIVMVSSEEVKKNLTGTVGGSITLPDPVEEGFLYCGGKNIAMVNERKIKIYDETYKDKVLWNSSTGLFTLTRLQRNDSGIYTVGFRTGKVFYTSYKLTVYESVSTPAVETLDVSAKSCTLQCFVQKAEETTLLWYKDEQILNQSSSSLSLPLTVLKKDFSSSYRCVAANPADQKTLPVNVTISCIENKDEPGGGNDGDRNRYVIAVVIPIVLALIIILVVLHKWKCSDKNKSTTIHQQSSKSQRAEETTLVLYKDEQMLNQSSLSLCLSLCSRRTSTPLSYEHGEQSVTNNPRVAVLQSWLFLIPMVVFVIAVANYIILTNVKTERRRETTTAAPSAIN